MDSTSRRQLLSRLVVVTLAVLVLARPTLLTPPQTQRSVSAAGTISLTPFASGFSGPLFVTHAGDSSNRLFVVERSGKIKIVRDGTVLPTAFLDVSGIITSANSEQGLLGLAFHPNYKSNGRFFVYYTASDGKDTLARYQVPSPDANLADPNGTVLIDLADRYTNHNAGMLAFGPDGYLYVGIGDEGSGGDPNNQAQNLGLLFGKLLRIDVDGSNSANGTYGIPADNPFVGQAGARGEIWAYGLRNPWRLSFDRTTGDLYIGDVGQNLYEEIDRQPAGQGGQNYGWRILEGMHCYNPNPCTPPADYAPPILEYAHGSGDCSVTGGYVYHGPRAPSLQGAYLYADYCSGRIWSYRASSGSPLVLDTPYSISSFGEDWDGEVYVTDLANGGIYRFAESGVPTPTSTPTRTPTPTVGGPAATATPTATPTPTSPAAPTATPTPTSTPTAGSLADLVITSLTASPTTADQAIPVQVTVKNQGAGSTQVDFDVHVYDDSTATPRLVLHFGTTVLGAGQSRLLTGDIVADTYTPGTYPLRAQADGHDVVVETDKTNNARTVSITVGCSVGQNWAEFFNNRNLSGTAAVTRCDTNGMNENWGAGGPGGGTGNNNFSARWTGWHTFAGGNYTFITQADDGARLWLDGSLVIDAWNQRGVERRVTRAVTAGQHQVRVEYFEKTGQANVRAEWVAGP